MDQSWPLKRAGRRCDLLLLIPLCIPFVLCTLSMQDASAQTPSTSKAPVGLVVIEIEGTAEFMAQGLAPWRPLVAKLPLQAGDRVRVHARSRLTVQLSDHSTARFDEGAEFGIDRPATPKATALVNFFKGLLYLFHRDEPTSIDIRHRTVSAAIRGTEFAFEATDDGRSVLTLLDGEVDLSNEVSTITLHSGEQGIAGPGQAPVKTAVIDKVNVIQWCLYYPAILDLDELGLAAAEQQVLGESIAAYRQGDLLQALAKYPPDRKPVSGAEKVYLAALLLAVGQVDQAEKSLNAANGLNEVHERLAGALRTLIAAVTLRLPPSTLNSQPSTATEWSAESYRQQALFKLPEALAAARKAVEKSPNFSFGWARVAELEFCFGRTSAARTAVAKSLKLAPRNAEALALKGFLLAAENRIGRAADAFDRAIAVDGALGNAWLGRGLCKIRRGQVQEGRADIQVAATLEPQRALLRGYLSKAWSEASDLPRAEKEIKLAKELDQNDPTAWLYSALLNQQNNRVNEGVRDLEKSLELTDNRGLFRSRQLLDQDRAVRGANLAALYRDAGMFEVSVREASSAVTSDYANHSAHLFLANSLNTLRDPNLVNLRYETPTFSEYLLANLLAPVGGTFLSPQVSQQEYVRLFERDGLGLSSATEYTSDGSWAQDASQYGVLGDLGYAVDASYRSTPGHRPNNDLSQFVGSGQFKLQLTPQDSLYFLAEYADSKFGDVRQYYDESQSSRTLRVTERQEPNVFAGYHREWSPGIHTLFLGARLNDTLLLQEPNALLRTVLRGSNGAVTNQVNPTYSQFGLDYQSEFNAYSAELQQILERPGHAVIAGVRYQTGDADTHSVVNRDPFLFPPVYNDPAAAQRFRTDLQRLSLYGYYHWQVVDSLWLIAGVSYDRLRFPENTDQPPINGRDVTRDQVSPKAGFLWSPWTSTTLRGAYAQSLGGLFYDTSVRLEPTQLAGFIQSYRSLIPESVAGSVPGSRFETFHLGLEQKFQSRTYVVLEADLLRSKGTQTVGVFDYFDAPPFTAVPSGTPQQLDFKEKSVAVAINQLVSEEWAFGARYRISDAELQRDFLEIPLSVDPTAKADERATLQQLDLFAIYQNAAGFFARAEALWRAQSNRGYLQPMPGNEFWQGNVFAGYRFPRRRAEVSIGLLDVADHNYRLNPLNLASDLPHHRTLVASFRFNF